MSDATPQRYRWTPSDALVVLAASIPLGIYKGWVLTLLWRWFVVPLGAPGVGVVHAMGLVWVAALLTHQLGAENSRRPAVVIASSLMFTTFALGFGWVLSVVTT